MNNYLKVLKHILNHPQTFQSNHFRHNASLYAEASSRGHITCLENGNSTGRWKISTIGHSFLNCYSTGGL